MLAARPGPALPASPPLLWGRVRSGPRGPLGVEAPDKGGAGAGAGGGVGEGSGSERPTPRGGRQARTLPRGLRGAGVPAGRSCGTGSPPKPRIALRF